MKHINWNNSWKTWEDQNAFSLVFVVPENAKEVDLPHDAIFETEQKPGSINGSRTGFLDGGIYQYYKKLEVYDEDKEYELRINGLGGIAKIYVNESVADEIIYPYTTKRIKLSPYLNCDGNDFALITVNAINLSSRYYVGGGLTRGVELLEKEKVAVDYLKYDCSDVTKESLNLNIEAGLVNQGAIVKDKILISLDDEIIYEENLQLEKDFVFKKSLSLKNISLWDAENPNLHRLKVEYYNDFEEVMAGFRSLEYSSENGLLVNGKKTLLRGACLHSDQGLLGGATYEDYELYRVSKLKQAGFNAIRSAHNPASDALLNACDKLGVYVMDEAFDTWAKPKNYCDSSLFFEKEKRNIIKLMVENDYNHPAVIMYSSGNEIGDIHTLKGIETSRLLTSYFHEFDKTRPATCGINGAFSTGRELIQVASDLTGKDKSEFEDGDINKFMFLIGTQMSEIVKHEAIEKVLEKLDGTMDILGYNYMTSRYSIDRKKHPERMVVGSETYPKEIATNWREINKNPNVLGDFTWTGFDYLGETRAYPELIAEAGDISIIGQRRPVSYYRELAYGLRNKPVISIREPANFHKPYQFGPWILTDSNMSYSYKNGDLLQVEVYSVGDKVELFQNGVSLGIKDNHEVRENFTCFDVNYIDGELRAVSYLNNEVLSEALLKSPGDLNKIEIKKYQYENLNFIEIYLVDEDGQICTKEEGLLKVEGDFLALASNSPLYDRGFKNPEIKMKNGTALLISKQEHFKISYGNLFINL